MHVFLTGGTGFIGQALVRAMQRRQWQVTALVRDPDGAPGRWLARQGATLVRGDIADVAGLRQWVAGADVVLHNAGVYELGADAALRQRMHEVNVTGTDNVLGAAAAARVPRTLYVSTVWALGPTGKAAADETQRHSGQFLSAYEQSKFEAHEVALRWRKQGLPLVIAMPNGVSGANDHSVFGYFLRMYLLHAMPPMAWNGDTIYSFVDVDALAEGLCLAAEKAPIGGDYLFCGEPTTLRETFSIWNRYPGSMKHRLWLPAWFMRPQMALMEPLLRAAGLPAFMSRETVDVSGANLNYSSAKAQRELGWTHPGREVMWDAIIARERELLAARAGFLNRLRHTPVTPD
jgi:dihydroflavonol-4-reductase